MCYTGRVKGCGCLVAACVDMPGHEKDTARAVADMVKGGLVVGREDTDVVRLTIQHCTHEEGDKQGDLFAGVSSEESTGGNDG